MTLPMADSAEMAHMPTVSASSRAASPGVMTMGKALLLAQIDDAERDDHAQRIAEHGAEAACARMTRWM